METKISVRLKKGEKAVIAITKQSFFETWRSLEEHFVLSRNAIMGVLKNSYLTNDEVEIYLKILC